ncbi:hypothetical protein CWM47_10315 [Spirosoma pollinicola]|uniref:Signal transduction histidine kinase internal region domain-containing protein n=2 Tax=Spirosoma pollinicola TaxID=2057025 RepID=A0A2K8YX18_9BACT|nr:hypothetical protein CWM47_10315 [Spirosoma pollinicola]
MWRAAVRILHLKSNRYLFIGIIALLFLTAYTFDDFSTKEIIPLLYIIPLACIFMLASVVYVCFFTFDVVPLLQKKEYKEFFKNKINYPFLWIFVCYVMWMVVMTDNTINTHSLKRINNDPLVKQLIALLPTEIGNNLKKDIFNKDKYEYRFVFSSFFLNDLIVILILSLFSFLYGIRKQVVGRPEWLQKGISKLFYYQHKLVEWLTIHRDKLVHSFFWFVLITYLWDEFIIIHSIMLATILIGVTLLSFYINMAVLIYILNRRGKHISIIIMGLVFFDGVLSVILIDTDIFVKDPNSLLKIHTLFEQLLLPLFIGAGVAAFAERTNGINRDKTNEIIMKQQAEIQALTYQIDPHFLFNSLTFIYSKSQQHSEDLAEAVLLLSEMMRYKLPKANNNYNVALIDEVEHLQDYIRFDQLIHPLNHVDFKPQGSFENLEIAPNLLDIFVENALKYGDIENENSPLNIRLTTIDTRITFRVYNKKRKRVVGSRASTQMGLRNARNRLNLIYSGRYELSILDEPTSYTVLLTIDL